jgi:hypothetical protein
MSRGTNGRVVAAAQLGKQWEVVVAFETRTESPPAHIPKRIMQRFWAEIEKKAT